MTQRKRTRPAMYELMKGQRVIGGGHQPQVHVDHGESSEFEPTPTVSWFEWLRSGRVVRLPAGYVFLSIAGVLLLLVVAYMFGYSRADKTSDITDDTSPNFAVNDPLANALPNEPGSPITNRTNNSSSSPATPTNANKPLDFDMSKLGPINSEPRLKGVNYYVLSTTNPAGAERLANFCRNNGLAAFVVPAAGKPSLRQVIVLPGIESSALSSSTAQQLKDRILEVGRKWKDAQHNSDDLSSAYAQQYGG